MMRNRRRRGTESSSINLENLVEQDSDDETDIDYDSRVQWSNVIFLPFNAYFRTIILFTVIIKITLAPVMSVYPLFDCGDIVNRYGFMKFAEFVYEYCCDSLYSVDTMLHIAHRAMTDQAMRREHLPKSALLLFLDVVSVLPLYRMKTAEDCSDFQPILYPNILAYTGLIQIYRLVEFFSMVTTHSWWRVSCGLALLMLVAANAIVCFTILLTHQGLCARCQDAVFDWRMYIEGKMYYSNEDWLTYIYGASFVATTLLNSAPNDILPSTIAEMILISAYSIIGFLFLIFIIFPKLFTERSLGYRMISEYRPYVNRILDEMKNRNLSKQDQSEIETFYKLMWKNRNGLRHIPELYDRLPRYLQLDIKLDLSWAAFFHSPILRNTSVPFKRSLCKDVVLDFKLPGENFFVEPRMRTGFYYIRSGVIQIMSNDDASTPLLSLTSGTVLGDIGFYVPCLNRNAQVRCLNYCEVYYISRSALLKTLVAFPKDRREMFAKAKERLQHAKILHECKTNILGLDRTEDEGIAWIKRRWREIFETICIWKKMLPNRETNEKCELPPEESIYHCSRYIGQLVLCNDAQLKEKSIFVRGKFPWILVPDSTFQEIWDKLIISTTAIVLIFYPAYITSNRHSILFMCLQHWTNIAFAMDICVYLMISIEKSEKIIIKSSEIMFERFKSLSFNLDLAAAAPVEWMTLILQKPQYYNVMQFNRLIKVYKIFVALRKIETDEIRKPMNRLHLFQVFLLHFSFAMIGGYVMYAVDMFYLRDDANHWLIKKYCPDISLNSTGQVNCDPDPFNVICVALTWSYDFNAFRILPYSTLDTYFILVMILLGFFIRQYCIATYVVINYIQFKMNQRYQQLVTSVRTYYKKNKIHPDLLQRLNDYLVCHWKYHKGLDILQQNYLKDEPYGIYRKIHGEIAEKVIKCSKYFLNADPMFLRELSHRATFLVLPANSNLILNARRVTNLHWVYKVLHISREILFEVFKRYPQEQQIFENCFEEIEVIYKQYQQKISNIQKIAEPLSLPVNERTSRRHRFVNFVNTLQNWSINPECRFVCVWNPFRAVVALLSVNCRALAGGGGAHWRRELDIVATLCDAVAVLDIIIKFVMAYYNELGVLVTDRWKCFQQYATRGLLLDLLGVLPCYAAAHHVLGDTIRYSHTTLVYTLSRYAHLYLPLGYMSYLADGLSGHSSTIKFLKHQLFIFVTANCFTHYFMWLCLDMRWDENLKLVSLTRKQQCWLPSHVNLDSPPFNVTEVYLFSWYMTLGGMYRIYTGQCQVSRSNWLAVIIMYGLGCVYWYSSARCIALLVMRARTHILYRHGVRQLVRFLREEGVEPELIDRAIKHYSYIWHRTGGVNLLSLMKERLSLMFRQDLTHYFYKDTLLGLSALRRGGESLSRRLAGSARVVHLLRAEPAVRERDVLASVYFVHRGRVLVHRGDNHLAVLGKGCMFGRFLSGARPRPARLAAAALENVDLLEIPTDKFDRILADHPEVAEALRKEPQAENDFITVEQPVQEDPADTLGYLLRPRLVLKLPMMSAAVEAGTSAYYRHWLALAWLVSPTVCAACLVLASPVVSLRDTLMVIIYCTDLVHFLHFVSEFYKIEMVVENGALVTRAVGWRCFRSWRFYADLAAFLPTHALQSRLSHVSSSKCWFLHYNRMIRLRLLGDYFFSLCRTIESSLMPAVIRIIVFILFLHSLTCIWMLVACSNQGRFPVELPAIAKIREIESGEWLLPWQRNGTGCARISQVYQTEDGKDVITYLVPRNWMSDYVVAFSYIVSHFTSSELDVVVPVTTGQLQYALFVLIATQMLFLWLVGMAASMMYTNYCELYHYDYNILKLRTYLAHTGLSPHLADLVQKYAKQLWRRQRGNWLPELASCAPACLRQELLGSLYRHHLSRPPALRHTPPHFSRQLVVRLGRVVFFPETRIVEAGDLHTCMYFIHEGEVEKWITEPDGDKKLVTLLSTNEYFGLVQGLYPGVAYKYSFVARTVVDLIFLRLRDWKDLLDAFPEVKRDIYETVRPDRL